jgi:hypothetical protein
LNKTHARAECGRKKIKREKERSDRPSHASSSDCAARQHNGEARKLDVGGCRLLETLFDYVNIMFGDINRRQREPLNVSGTDGAHPKQRASLFPKLHFFVSFGEKKQKKSPNAKTRGDARFFFS